MKKSYGFTLIELLIVVAIIAILAAIAVPNFLEAQTRSKVSRVRSDMRTGAVAAESFYIDHSFYPADGIANEPGQYIAPIKDKLTRRYAEWHVDIPVKAPANFWRWDNTAFILTTPVAYLTSIPKDPFSEKDKYGFAGSTIWLNMQDRNAIYAKDGGYIWSVDPSVGANDVDGKKTALWVNESFGPDGILNSSTGKNKDLYVAYDPTNGTVSFGDIFRAGP